MSSQRISPNTQFEFYGSHHNITLLVASESAPNNDTEGNMSTYSKVKDLSARILDECEKSGLSIREVNFLLTQLQIDIGNSVGEETNPLPFKSHIVR